MNETIADRHRRLAAAFQATVAAVPTELLDRPTHCEGWTVASIIEHVTNTQRDFLTERGIDVTERADLAQVAATMQATLDDSAVANAAYDGYFGPTTISDTVDAFYSLDLVVHRWDIAAAAGLDDHLTIGDDDIARCRDLMAPMGDNVRMPGIFGPEVDCADDASPTDRFVAWTGRQPQPS